MFVTCTPQNRLRIKSIGNPADFSDLAFATNLLESQLKHIKSNFLPISVISTSSCKLIRDENH